MYKCRSCGGTGINDQIDPLDETRHTCSDCFGSGEVVGSVYDKQLLKDVESLDSSNPVLFNGEPND